MKYKIAFDCSMEQSKACRGLTEEVEQYIMQGYKPFGAIQAVYSGGFYSLFQAMIKED